MRPGIITVLVLLLATTSAFADWDVGDAASALPERGEYHLALFNGDERDGFMRLGWYREGEDTVVWDRTMMPSGEIFETLTLRMGAFDWRPREVSIRFHQGTAILLVGAGLVDGAIAGTRTMHRPGEDDQHREIATDVAPGTVFRAVSFLLPLVLPAEPGQEASYDWYAPLSDTVATVTLTSSDGGSVETPAGTFDTVRWELRGGSPENDIYVTTGETPRIVRIDVVDQPLQFLAVEP